MNYIIKYGKRLLWMSLSIIITLLFITVLYYFNIISKDLNHIFMLINLIINIFISAYILGKNSTKKGYIEGIKHSLIIIILFFIFTLLSREVLSYKVLIYYIIIITSSILGSISGINKKLADS